MKKIELHRGPIVTRAVLTLALLLTTGSLATAQDRLFALLPSQGSAIDRASLIEIDMRPGLVGQVRRSIAVPSPGFFNEPYSIGAGRFLVWLSGNSDVVSLFDTLTNQLTAFPGLVPSRSKIVAADSARMRVFAASDAGIHILDGLTGTVRFVQLPMRTPFVLGAHASTAQRLIVARSFDAIAGAIDVIDVVNGRVESGFRLGTTGATGLAVDADGRRIFVTATSRLSAYEAATGALLAETTALGANLDGERNALQIDQARRRLMVTSANNPARPNDPSGARVTVFDLDTFTLLGVAAVQDPIWNDGAGTPFHMLTGPRSPLYVFSSLLSSQQCRTARFEVLDPNSGTRQQRVEVSQLWGALLRTPVCNARLVLQSPPSMPTLLSPVVSGNRVTLSWTPSTDVVHYDVEVGTAPGRRDLVTPTTGTTFVAPDVPPGTYHVRIRAINVVGRSLPSNEITVVVL